MKLIARSYQFVTNKIAASSLDRDKQEAIKSIKKFPTPYKLNVGSGTVKLKKWVNVDIEKVANVTDVVWDATHKFSFLDDASCSLIYNEHFLEHLDIQDGMSFLSECYRLLAPGGTLRVAMPSLEYVTQKYMSEDWQDQDWLKWPGHEFIQTRAEMLNIALRWWGHKWLYDREELHRRLHESGFKFENIRDVQWGSSEIQDFNNLETRKDSILICESRR
jgi:predicted SAM-dependent methyltransferase